MRLFVLNMLINLKYAKAKQGYLLWRRHYESIFFKKMRSQSEAICYKEANHFFKK